jgi:hypothetical protein
MQRTCYVCDRKLSNNPNVAVTSDGKIVYIGSECYRNISALGWQPPKGGPVLYKGRFNPAGQLIEIVKRS